jgi:uncharacterized integral membrane protein
MKPKNVIILISALIFIIILLQNTQVINFNFLFWTISMSQIILLFIVIVLSFLMGYFSHMLKNKNKTKI